MLEIVIPGDTTLGLQHLVLDYNGTLACDGELLAGVKARLDDLSRHLDIHVLTADTFGKARSALADVPCDLTVLPVEDQAAGKLRYVERLNPSKVAYIGNGRNDRLPSRSRPWQSRSSRQKARPFRPWSSRMW